MASRRKTQRIREAFRMFDADGNGKIDREELRAVFTELGTFSTEHIDLLMKEADRNGDGVVDFTEFVGWLTPAKQVVRGATLLAQCEQRLIAHDQRDADFYAAHQRPPEWLDNLMTWRFGPGYPGPLPLETSILLGFEFTIAMWVRFDFSTSDWVNLVGDEVWGLEMGMSPDGSFVMNDPRGLSDPVEVLTRLRGPQDVWTLVFFCGSCTGESPGPEGSMDFYAARRGSDGVQHLGSLSRTASGIVVTHLGCRASEPLDLAAFFAWPRLLEEEEMRDVFLWDAEGFGCVTQKEAERLRLGRRQAPPRTPAEEAALQKLLKKLAAGQLVTGTLDMSSMKIVDADLPSILEAVDDGGCTISCLQLSDNYLSEESVIEPLAPFMARRMQPLRVVLAGNSDISEEAEGPLLSAVPLGLGCSVDLRGTKFSEHGISVLLNNTDDAMTLMREDAEDRQKTRARCLEYEARDAELRERWADTVDLEVPEEYRQDASLPPEGLIILSVDEARRRLSESELPQIRIQEYARNTAKYVKEFRRSRVHEENGPYYRMFAIQYAIVVLLVDDPGVGGASWRADPWEYANERVSGWVGQSLEMRMMSYQQPRGRYTWPRLQLLMEASQEVTAIIEEHPGERDKVSWLMDVREWSDNAISQMLALYVSGAYCDSSIIPGVQPSGSAERDPAFGVQPSGSAERDPAFGTLARDPAAPERGAAVDDGTTASAVFPLGKADQLKELMKYLSRAGRQMYDLESGDRFAWDKSKRPPHCGTGQFIAHFSFLCWSVELKAPEDFGLRVRTPGEGCSTDASALTIHQAAEQGLILFAASGHSLGAGALRLRIRNLGHQGTLRLVIPAGTIFQHIAWVHRQNLLVGFQKTIYCRYQEDVMTKLSAYCMNLSCACSGGEEMFLTSLMFERKDVLRTQNRVWDHFESIIEQCQADTGLKQAGKGKKGRKGGKKGRR